MSTIADYSVFTKAFLASKDVDFSKLYGMMGQGGSWGEEGLRGAFAVIPFNLTPPLTPREAMNFDQSKFGKDAGFGTVNMWDRVSCRDENGQFIGNIVRVQPGVREGSIRFVAKVAVTYPVTSEGGSNPADAPYNTFVFVRTDPSTNINLPIAVATISKGYTLHKHIASGIDPLDDVENANYVSFTINHLNGYTSVDFNPDAYATYDDVANALSRGIDGLHIAFDTASGDLKLLDKDGNVLDQANLPIKTDVIIAEGEEGYKYVKTDVKQDIHAAKAWMPEGFTAWNAVGEVPYTMQHAALVVGKGSTPASRVFVDTGTGYNHPISTEPVQFEHVVIGGSTYMVTDKTEAGCNLRKVKGEAGEPFITNAVISGEEVTLNSQPDQTYTIIKNKSVEVDVIKDKDGVTPLVLVGTNNPDQFQALSLDGNTRFSGSIVTFEGSSAASRVFVTMKSGSFPISTEPVQFEHVVIGGSTYMVTGKNGAGCSLLKVKGEAGEPFITDVVTSGEEVTLNSQPGQTYTIIKNESVEVDVIKDGVTPLVLVGPEKSGEFQAFSLDGNNHFPGFIVTFEGSSADKVLGITLDGQSMYTFEGVENTITSSSNKSVKWFGKKDIPAGTSLKYGLEAFVWTVKGAEVTITDPFFQQLNASLLALGFHKGDDIALGTNLATLAPTEGVSPLNKVDADEYMHGKGNKATREQEVNTQRANAKEELVAWNAQHPALTEDREHGTIIDSSGLDVRDGRITLGCGRTGKEGVFQKVNYGIQMGQRFGAGEDQNTYDSLDFTVSHHTGKVQFDENGHAAQPGGNSGLVPLTSSTLLSIEAGSYISGAPTCLILAEVTHNSNSEGGPMVFTPVRMTAGFSVESPYDPSSGLSLTIHDYRDNIAAVYNPNNYAHIPAIIEVQAIYTHRNAQSETVPAQQMHTYIGEWTTISAESVHAHPGCSFLCNKIEEWMTAVGLADTTPAEDVKLYVVIRVY